MELVYDIVSTQAIWDDAMMLRVERRTNDREVSGSTPVRVLLAQQPWASCSHVCASVTKQYKLVPV